MSGRRMVSLTWSGVWYCVSVMFGLASVARLHSIVLVHVRTQIEWSAAAR